MKQQTLAKASDLDAAFANYRKPARRDAFLKKIESIAPRAMLCKVVKPHCPKAGNGRPPTGLERKLRIQLIPDGVKQAWMHIGHALAASDDRADLNLARSITRFVDEMRLTTSLARTERAPDKTKDAKSIDIALPR